MTGKEKIADHRAKISKAMKGKKLTAEHCAKMSKAIMGKNNKHPVEATTENLGALPHMFYFNEKRKTTLERRRE